MKRIILLIWVLAACFLIASCGKKQQEPKKLIKETPVIAPYKEFDLSTIMNKEAGVTYTYSGIYLNSRGNEKTITFDGDKFTIPENDTVAEIDIEYNGKTEHVALSVIGYEDVIDEGMISLWCEDSIAKTANFNPQYIKEGNSSIKVTFNGYHVNYGTQFICLCGHLSNNDGKGIYDRPYYSIYKEENVEEAWKDAVFYYWVYNTIQPSDKYDSTDLEFGCRIKTRDDKVNFDWGPANVQVAKAGEWTMYVLRLKNFGVTKDLEKDIDAFYSSSAVAWAESYDSLNMKVRGLNQAKDEFGNVDTSIKQNYVFYVDGFNFCSYKQFKEMYPDYDIDSQAVSDTWKSEVTPIDNWKNSGKGISFDFKLKDPASGATNYKFSLLNSEWDRLSDYITLDLASVTASYGRLTKKSDNVYHYELMFSEINFNTQDAPKFVPDGTETFGMIYFREYPAKMLMSYFTVITNYSE